MEGTSTEPELDGLDAAQVLSYLRAIWRGRWLVAGVTALAVALVGVYTARKPRIYSATTTVIIDLSSPRVLDSSEVQEVLNEERANYYLAEEYAQTQLSIMESRAVASRVVEKLGLATDRSFLGLTGVKDEKLAAQLMAEIDAVDLVRARASVTLEKSSRLVSVTVRDEDPRRAALLANELAEAYIAESLDLKLRVSESASVWLEQRLKELEVKSKSSEMAVYEFKKSSDVLTTALQDKLSIVSERLNAFNVALTQVRTRIAELNARVHAMAELRKAARGAPSWAEGLPMADSRLLDDSRQRLFATRAECAELADRYLDGHPRLTACRERLTTQQEDIQRVLQQRVTAAETELLEAKQNEKNLLALLEAAKKEAFEVNRKQIEFDRLQRESDNDQRLYEIVLKRLKDIELSGLLRTSNVRILDRALPSDVPVSPRVSLNLLLALLAGLGLGVMLALLLEHLDNTVKGQQDAEEHLQVPVLGVFPALPGGPQVRPSERDLHVFRNPTSPAAECCRGIRTNLLFASPDRPWKTLVVTSSGPSEGKSTLAVNLGVAMAQSGHRVLLVDADLRRPRLQRVFGVPGDAGVSSLVVGEGSVEAAVRSTEVPGLFVLPSGPLPPNPAELLQSQAFGTLLGALAERFDRIILDSPPVNAVVDAVLLGTQVDGVLLVLRAQKTQRTLAL
ncbi:MAG: polysaccharide biosynthesis tyrosine autokinase, partial [Myxococcaceae bacterium]|nr:polysaccharide biosynthesis tyrosine autokinase [Myxococcaceae bacterium]